MQDQSKAEENRDARRNILLAAWLIHRDILARFSPPEGVVDVAGDEDSIDRCLR